MTLTRQKEYPFPENINTVEDVQKYLRLLYTAIIEDRQAGLSDMNLTDINTIGDITCVNLTASSTVTFGGLGYTWPSSDGGASDFLQTNGSLGLSWATPTWLGLSDTAGSFTAKKLPVVNEAGNAIALASNMEWDETNDRLEITSFNAHCIRSIRSTSETNISGSALKLTHKTSGSMADGFGVALAFAIDDDTSSEEVIGNLQCVRDGADDSGKFNFKLWKDGTASIVGVLTKDSNLLLGDDQDTEPASLTKGIVLYTGTAPSGSVPDTFSMYAADAAGAATAAPHFRTEDGKVIKLYQSLAISDEVEFAKLTVNSIEIVGTDGEVNKSTVEDSGNWDDAYTHSQIAGGNSVHVSTTENTNWDAAYAHVSSNGTDHGYINQDLQTSASPTLADLTLSSPSNIYALSHDSFADFAASEHFTMLDEDDMASDSNTQAATQQSIKAYVDSAPSSMMWAVVFGGM